MQFAASPNERVTCSVSGTVLDVLVHKAIEVTRRSTSCRPSDGHAVPITLAIPNGELIELKDLSESMQLTCFEAPMAEIADRCVRRASIVTVALGARTTFHQLVQVLEFLSLRARS